MRFANLLVAFLSSSVCISPSGAQTPAPVIDMHLHALPPEAFLQHRLSAPVECALPTMIPPLDVARAPSGDLAGAYFKARLAGCARPLQPAATGDDLLRRTIAILRHHNITAVTSGDSLAYVREWKEAAPDHILPALLISTPAGLDTANLRHLVTTGEIQVLGEVGTQYGGLSPGDPSLDPLYSLAEDLDIPIGIHVAVSAPGIPAVTLPTYRASGTRPLDLERVLLAHPRLRLYVMHAGWPMGEEMLHLLWSYPQVYVDISGIDWLLPQKEFYVYLRRLVDAGFGERIMFGSDQMVWPEAIDVALDNLQRAPFLSDQQRRDILYNNAARFLRFTKGAHH